ncbi:helix-turn-helix domain-containing protein [Nonomuraea diastatica]|uniref:XRE family transcriptional regulator n=1 Tax=Nonomuraea diastatica TaxID=1848329 RepID=A0A4R4WDD6_9ACTN|nr:helix-turn-helix transcriptional regulator [Nonomuraea diastatica]TDD14074.1 XRE family transcriptional regulator [Nonomuraea diastatica]
MTATFDYRWHLRAVMADRGLYATTDLRPLLAERGFPLSQSQVYRLVAERPERLSLPILMALLDILNCTIEDLIEPVRKADGQEARPSGTQARFGSRPTRARVLPET